MTTSWTLHPGQGLDSLELKEAPRPQLGQRQARVALKARSINARDLMVALGQSPMPAAEELTPLSDGAGIVEEVGEEVRHVSVGDRVVVTFNPAHQSGPYRPDMEPSALGAMEQGLLTQEAVLPEMALVKLPASIPFEQAACLPCVGVTAWNALFEAGPLMPGQTVLATGTGMLSLTALQLAKAAGVRFGVTSSDDAKIARAVELGADFGVNYRARDDWEQSVYEATQGGGANVVLENAGPPSVATSIRAAAQGGRVMQIGWKGMSGPPINVLDLALRGVSLVPVMVGSRAMLERLVAAVAVNAIKIPIHDRFEYAEAPAAFEAFQSGQNFGKIIIANA